MCKSCEHKDAIIFDLKQEINTLKNKLGKYPNTYPYKTMAQKEFFDCYSELNTLINKIDFYRIKMHEKAILLEKELIESTK